MNLAGKGQKNNGFLTIERSTEPLAIRDMIAYEEELLDNRPYDSAGN
jgi:hypothetical protein